MAYEPLIKEDPTPESAPAPAPDPMAGVNAQLAEMRAQINAAYQANKGIQPQVQYVPYIPQQQEVEPELTEADVLADLPGAIQREAMRIAAERERALREELGTHLGRVYEKDFERDLKDLSAQPHYKFIESDLKDYFTQHPEEKYQPGRLMEKYYQFVGSKVNDIRAAEQADTEARVRAVDHAIPVSSSPVPSRAPKDEPQLPEDEETARQEWNRKAKVNISKTEWAKIRDGELLWQIDDGPDNEETF